MEAILCLLYIEVFADVELAVQCIIVQRSGLEILFAVYNFWAKRLSPALFSRESASVNLQNQENQARKNMKNTPLL